MALDPDCVECDRCERLSDRFDDEGRTLADAIDGVPRVECRYAVRDILDGIATVHFAIDLSVVATLGEVEDRFELLVNEMLAALPENVRRARKQRESDMNAADVKDTGPDECKHTMRDMAEVAPAITVCLQCRAVRIWVHRNGCGRYMRPSKMTQEDWDAVSPESHDSFKQFMGRN